MAIHAMGAPLRVWAARPERRVFTTLVVGERQPGVGPVAAPPLVVRRAGGRVRALVV